MTEPQFGGSEHGTPPPPPQQPSGYPPPPQAPGYPPPGAYQPSGQYPMPPRGPYPGSYADPGAPYGRHPLTGEPLSDRSKVVGGLLQLLGLFGLVGIGRIYLGYTGLGIAQLIVGLVAGFIVGIFTCGVGLLIPVIWGIVDAILILTDKVRDPMGRPLRGT